MKPELLLPAGNVEAFYAALEGGADAIYLGLSDFNARKRAKNFTIQQLPSLVQLAHEKNAKLFITLNTVLKNNELPNIYSLLYQINQTDVDAVIIQDWGLFHLIKTYFPKLEVHASTQMAFHNSLGVNFGKKLGLDRLILARELTKQELWDIKKNSKAPIELFVHGALCYSFSGLCLFSSYLGGMSANRGACKQPCRRLFTDNNNKRYIFSLKDNELIDIIPELCKLGVESLKVEGRMKSADYTYTIAKAYRIAIDTPEELPKAKQLLSKDIGREKTSYFIGGNVSDAITDLPNTGLYLGKIQESNNKGFSFNSAINATEIGRIRICSPDGKKQINVKTPEVNNSQGLAHVTKPLTDIEKGDLVYAIGFSNQKFPSKLNLTTNKTPQLPSLNEAKKRTTNLTNSKRWPGVKLFFRIDSLAWLRKIRLDDMDYLILNLPSKEWGNLPLSARFMANSKHKIIIELPKFIPEGNINKYKKLIQQLNKAGIKNFMISHLSQIALLPKKSYAYCNENVYTFNDSAVAFLKKLNVAGYIYPLENDLANLTDGKDRSGIVPLHFTPQLFYSRMPVRTNNASGAFKDDTNIDYQVVKKEGMTITLPQKPVSILQSKHELVQKGFKHFLVDVSFTSPSQNVFKSLVRKYYKAEQSQPSTSFNFKKGLN